MRSGLPKIKRRSSRLVTGMFCREKSSASGFSFRSFTNLHRDATADQFPTEVAKKVVVPPSFQAASHQSHTPGSVGKNSAIHRLTVIPFLASRQVPLTFDSWLDKDGPIAKINLLKIAPCPKLIFIVISEGAASRGVIRRCIDRCKNPGAIDGNNSAAAAGTYARDPRPAPQACRFGPPKGSFLHFSHKLARETPPGAESPLHPRNPGPSAHRDRERRH